ncbi:hypothetical protein V8F33_012093 [Rhypophila sp. PSN 637]
MMLILPRPRQTVGLKLTLLCLALPCLPVPYRMAPRYGRYFAVKLGHMYWQYQSPTRWLIYGISCLGFFLGAIIFCPIVLL